MFVEGSVKRYLADNYGIAALEVTEQGTCGLSLIVVVNAVIVGLAATVAYAIVEIATHLV